MWLLGHIAKRQTHFCRHLSKVGYNDPCNVVKTHSVVINCLFVCLVMSMSFKFSIDIRVSWLQPLLMACQCQHAERTMQFPTRRTTTAPTNSLNILQYCYRRHVCITNKTFRIFCRVTCATTQQYYYFVHEQLKINK